MADDLLAAVVLASRAPVLLAPAMNVNMWENPLTQANLARLLGSTGGGRFAPSAPIAGRWPAAGSAQGRLIEPAEILLAARAGLRGAARSRGAAGRGRPRGRRTSRSTTCASSAIGRRGRWASHRGGGGGARRAGDADRRAGRAADAARRRARVDVETAEQMRRRSRRGGRRRRGGHGGGGRRLPSGGAGRRQAVASGAAATGRRWRSRWRRTPTCWRTSGGARRAAPAVPGRVRGRGGRRRRRWSRARATSWSRRAATLIVANDVSAPGIGFGSDDNAVTLIFADGRAVALARARSWPIADELWDHSARGARGAPAAARSAAAPRRRACRSPRRIRRHREERQLPDPASKLIPPKRSATSARGRRAGGTPASGGAAAGNVPPWPGVRRPGLSRHAGGDLDLGAPPAPVGRHPLRGEPRRRLGVRRSAARRFVPEAIGRPPATRPPTTARSLLMAHGAERGSTPATARRQPLAAARRALLAAHLGELARSRRARLPRPGLPRLGAHRVRARRRGSRAAGRGPALRRARVRHEAAAAVRDGAGAPRGLFDFSSTTATRVLAVSPPRATRRSWARGCASASRPSCRRRS